MSDLDLSFPHRVDSEGNYHSICRTCFQTVAILPREADLTAAEKRHKCKGAPLALGPKPASVERMELLRRRA
jgi:hypothetical protein